jgi:hypothetical protein
MKKTAKLAALILCGLISVTSISYAQENPSSEPKKTQTEKSAEKHGKNHHKHHGKKHKNSN